VCRKSADFAIASKWSPLCVLKSKKSIFDKLSDLTNLLVTTVSSQGMIKMENKEEILNLLLNALASLTDDLDNIALTSADKNAHYFSSLIKALGAIEYQKLAIEMQKFEVLSELAILLEAMQK
jgi:hypothetical protein